MMAKNVLENKKRVAHFKNNFSKATCMVSSIMEVMDEGKKKTIEELLQGPKKKSTEEINANKSILISQEELKPNAYRSKKFHSTKKFPLMEKTQRTLKQLRHNRKMPKPRAHISDTSTAVCNVTNRMESTKRPNLKNVKQCANGSKKRTSESNERKRSVSKKIELDNQQNPKLAAGSREDNPLSSDCSNDYHIESTRRPNIKNVKQRANDGVSKKSFESNNERKLSVSKKVKLDTLENPKLATERLEGNTVSSDGDSDYEKFVAQNKVHKCRTTKKLNKKQKNSKKCESTIKKLPTKRASNKSKEKDSDYSDALLTSGLELRRITRQVANKATKSVPLEDDSALYESPSTSSHRSRRVKNSYKITEPTYQESFNDSEPEMDFDGETYTRDSSESDVDTPIAEQSYTATSKQIASEDSCARETDAVTPETNCGILTTNLLKENLTTSSTFTENVPTVYFSDCKQLNQPIVRRPCSTSPVATNTWEDNLIDLCESDAESDDAVNCTLTALQKEENNFMPTNVKNESNDEPEIEVLDIIIFEKDQSNKTSLASKSTNNCELNIKTEKGISQTSPNIDIKPGIGVKNSEAAYMTDICRGSVVSEASYVTERNTDIAQLDKPTLSVKKENDDDDDIIIIDSINTKKKCLEPLNPSDNNSLISHFGSSDVQKELKLYEVACKNLTPKLTSFYENTNNIVTAFPQQGVGKDYKMILQELKNEFDTYREIIRTEESIGATFRSLEQNQAKKLMHLKSLLASHLKCNDTESSRIKKEIDLLMASSTMESGLEGSSNISRRSSSRETQSSQNVYGTAQSSTHPQDLVSEIPKDVARDVKPDITKLETPRSPAANDMSFGEKCIICGKDAVAACQSCARVFFCSNECGLKYWNGGHSKECGQ